MKKKKDDNPKVLYASTMYWYHCKHCGKLNLLCREGDEALKVLKEYKEE